MTSIDSATPSAFAELLAGMSPAEVQDWLDDRVAEMAAAIEAKLGGLVRDAADRFLAGLTAAGDPAAFDGITQAWSAFVGQTIGPNLAVLHKTGQLAAILTAPTNQPMGANQPALWDMKVIDQEAVNWAYGNAAQRVTNVGAELATQIKNRVYAAVATGKTTEETKDAIRKVAAGMSEFRADTIARTEILAAYNNGDQAGAKALGIHGPVEKVWMAAIDARTRETHAAANGQVRKFAEPFDVGGVSMMFPHAPGAPAGEVVNCRCVCNHLYAGDTRPDGTIVAPPPTPLPPPQPMPLPPSDPSFSAPIPAGKPAPEPPVPGKKMSDAQLDKWIRDQLVYDPKASATKLLAHARSQGLSVSQERMRKAVQAAKAPGVVDPTSTSGANLAVSGGPTGKRGTPSKATVTFMREHDHPIEKLPSKDMTPESAARRYTASSAQVNSALRQSGSHQMAANLDAALKPPTKPIEVYRGAKLDTAHLPTGGVPGLQGKVFRDRGYLSTSAGVDKGPAFGGNIGMRITVNSSGSGAYVRPISHFNSEREYLLARDQPLYVTTVRKPNPDVAWEKRFQWIVEAETVSPDWVLKQGANSVWDSNKGGWAAW